MRILLSHGLPFSLAHGGTQTVINELMIEYAHLGINVDYEKWWLQEQPCDIIHSFGRPSYINVKLAHEKGIRTVMTEYLDQVSSRPQWYRLLQRFAVQSLGCVNGGSMDRLGWKVYKELNALIYTTQHEWEVAQYIFGANHNCGYIIPHGLRPEAINALSRSSTSGQYLVSVATITERKNSILLAKAAIEANIPVHFIGKPYAKDKYFRQFSELVDNKYVFYHGFVSEEEKYELLIKAKGFVLLSRFESGCVAVYEAAAAGLPLLLPSLPWAETGYPDTKYLSHVRLTNIKNIANGLTSFYENNKRQSDMTFPVLSWNDIAKKYVEIYEKVMNESK